MSPHKLGDVVDLPAQEVDAVLAPCLRFLGSLSQGRRSVDCLSHADSESSRMSQTRAGRTHAGITQFPGRCHTVGMVCTFWWEEAL